jgi:hypothetical protein
LQVELKAVEARLMAWHRANTDSCRLAKIPSIGLIGATALVMKAPDPRLFPSGRHFAAWIGLTPKDHSTAGKTRLGKITRAGDEMLRSVLVAGATSVIQQAKKGRGRPSPWLVALLARKPPKLAAVALANKTARIAWKLLTTGESSRTTHGAQECIDACRLFADMLARAFDGAAKPAILFSREALAVQSPALRAIADGAYRGKTAEEVRGTGYVVDCLEAALWCFLTTDSFAAAILQAANLGDDADTTGLTLWHAPVVFPGPHASSSSSVPLNPRYASGLML